MSLSLVAVNKPVDAAKLALKYPSDFTVSTLEVPPHTRAGTRSGTRRWSPVNCSGSRRQDDSHNQGCSNKCGAAEIAGGRSAFAECPPGRWREKRFSSANDRENNSESARRDAGTVIKKSEVAYYGIIDPFRLRVFIRLLPLFRGMKILDHDVQARIREAYFRVARACTRTNEDFGNCFNLASANESQSRKKNRRGSRWGGSSS